jgi:hypothetical protein
MTKTITMTDLLKKPKQIKEGVRQGFSFVVLVNKEPLFDIKPHVTDKSKSTKFADRPTLPLKNLPDTLTKRDIYEKYGA